MWTTVVEALWEVFHSCRAFRAMPFTQSGIAKHRGNPGLT